ncbi:MAG: PaaI family thioesterase [Candidatus Dormibacteraceae bacterium]
MNESASELSAFESPWAKEMGITLTEASAERVNAEWEVSPRHHQAQGIVHGGFYCSVVETLASIGAAIAARPRNQIVVGLENSTSFLRAVRSGRLYAVAMPLNQGRTTQLWEVKIRDQAERLIATGRLRTIALEEKLGR